jgi:SAM-dependent methyltransferase
MATKKSEQLSQEVNRVLNAGKAVSLETVDFSDPARPKTCLEVDFPISYINGLASIEASSGSTKKPIYQLSKWWARRQPSVFRALLLGAATKAPIDTAQCAKLVQDNFYANHKKKAWAADLKVADIFMGGGTTLIEGSRLGMKMLGNDINPVAWFVVSQEFSQVNPQDVDRLVADIEAVVKPEIAPFYFCDGPNGELGTWTHLPSKTTLSSEFDPLALKPEERRDYSYVGPEMVYTFWAKHGPCQVTGCGHRTPIMSSPLVATKSITIKQWDHQCGKCGESFDIEDTSPRISPDAPLYVVPTERKFAQPSTNGTVICPICASETRPKLERGTSKKVQLSLLVTNNWLGGSPKADSDGNPMGGSSQDDAESMSRWIQERSKDSQLIEVRGPLPDHLEWPQQGVSLRTDKQGGTVPKRSHYACASCGTVQDLTTTVRSTKKTAPIAPYAIHGHSPMRQAHGEAYSGRFFSSFDSRLMRQYQVVAKEWEHRKSTDLSDYWPQSAIPEGLTTTVKDVLPNGHGFDTWASMFNARQLLTHSLLLKAILTTGDYSTEVRSFVLAAFQQYLRNNNLFTIWNIQADQLEPFFSNNNYNPKNTTVENNVFANFGRGNWKACIEGLKETLAWKANPWETVSIENLRSRTPELAANFSGKSTKAYPGDAVGAADIRCRSATDLSDVASSTVDLVVTDPPFGDNIQYAELSDFFYVWLRLARKTLDLKGFDGALTPKSLEVVTNQFREGKDADNFFQRLLTEAWKEAHRILKPGGLLTFTFHHSEDEPWVAVLESLFDAGFYLEATYPIRSDETKGDGQFGSQKIEYDIIHVCRKRTDEPKPVSWGRMRREVMADVRQLQAMLENHAKAGLPDADIQVIRRGKALEYFSRHYGKVYVDEGRVISVKDALIGINQLIDEDGKSGQEPPPVTAEPISRQFLRIFDGKSEVARDQMQKFMKGSGSAPDEFENRGWCVEQNKIFILVDPLAFARDWQGKHKRKLTSDLDQAFVLIGACVDGSGISAGDTLKNENFKPHAALKALLDWITKRGANLQTRTAATRALSIYNNWAASNQQQVQQMALFFDEA